MRFSLFSAPLLILPLLLTTVSGRVVKLPPLDEDGLPKIELVSKGAPPPEPIPKLNELTSKNFEETISKGYWFVKHYSPLCHHCKAMAPYFNALHEIYTPSKVSETHNFHIAALNCDAYGDICENEDYKIRAYPTLNLYKDGKLIDAYPPSGERTVEMFSNWVEEWLEKIKPASGGATTTTAAPVAKSTPSPSPIRNPKGESVPFDRQTFVDVVQSTRDPWLIKFYAPWCGHCQAMAPAWVNLAKQMQNKLNIGEVNCDVEQRICKALHVEGYPTILFLSGGEQVVYNGLRGVGDLVNYASKAAESGLKELDAGMLDDVEAKEEVYFVYFYDKATTSEDFAAIERVTLPLIGRAPIYKTSSEAIAQKYRVNTFPRLLVIRDGVQTYFPAKAPKDLRDHRKILDWMKSVWLPMVPELTAANSHEIMNDKFVVLAILSRKREKEFSAARKELKEAATQWLEIRAQAERAERQEARNKKEMKIEEAEDRGDEKALKEAKNMKIELSSTTRTSQSGKGKKKEVGFAWVDGDFWDLWVRSIYGIDASKDGEVVVINDEDNKWVWEFNSKGERIPLRRSGILETLTQVVDGVRGGHLGGRSTSAGWLPSLPGGWLFWAMVFTAVGGAVWWSRGRIRRGPAGHGGHGYASWMGLDGGEKGWLGAGNVGAPGKFD